MKMEARRRAIDKIYKRRDRIDMPDFQREEIWPDYKKRLLIDTILKGWHLPKFYFHKLDDGSFECIDGQQRLVAIIEFFDDQLQLDPETVRQVRGSKYSELPDEVSDAFDDFEIDVEEIEDATEEDLEELFQRLQLGTPLNTAERLNAIRGELRDFCHQLADADFFANKIALRDTRYAHFEIVARWAFVEARGIHPLMRFPQLESLLKENRSFSSQSATAKRMARAVAFLDKASPSKFPHIRNRANTLSICMLAARVVDHNLDTDAAAQEFREFVETFFTQLSAEVEKGAKAVDKELLRYQHAITSGSTGGDSVKARISIFASRLAALSPRFAPLLEAYPDVADETIRDISELASTVRELVVNANRRYSAAMGSDLFKMTTELASALSALEAPCRDIDGYGKLIDALYVLVYEGTGECKRLPSPPPEFAMDIKFLRGALRHDLDHGDPKEAAKKKTRNAQVLEKYSGKKTPQECGPEEFLSAHVRILREMVAFLEALQGQST